MDQNELVINLMQNIVDKLDDISAKVNIEKEVGLDEGVIKSISDYPKRLTAFSQGLFNSLKIINKAVETAEKNIQDTIVCNKPEVKNYLKKEYVLFGKGTPFMSKFLLVVIIIVLFASYGFKYIPDYLLEQSTVKIERDEYKLFYQYVFLKSYDKSESKSQEAQSVLNKIKSNDSLLMSDYSKLYSTYKNAIQKERLKAQLKALSVSP